MTDQPLSWFMIERGWAVVASDGTEVGKVHEVVGDENADIFDGLAVSAGHLGRTLYVPAEQVGEITTGRVALRIGPEDAERLGVYTEPPPSEELLSERSSLLERVAGWFRGPRG